MKQLSFVKKAGDFSFAKKAAHPKGISYKGKVWFYASWPRGHKARSKWWNLGFK